MRIDLSMNLRGTCYLSRENGMISQFQELYYNTSCLCSLQVFSTFYILPFSFLLLVLCTMPDHATLPTLTTFPKYKYLYTPIPHRLNYPIGARRGRHLSQPGVGHSVQYPYLALTAKIGHPAHMTGQSLRSLSRCLYRVIVDANINAETR